MGTIRLRDTRGKRLGVILFVLSPLAVLALLCWWMYFALRSAPEMAAEPRGAGAGHTGMSNEYVGLGKGRPAAASAPSTGAATKPAH